MDFRLVSDYSPRGDQVTAIDALVRGIENGAQHQVLLGVTGSGKTYTAGRAYLPICGMYATFGLPDD